MRCIYSVRCNFLLDTSGASIYVPIIFDGLNYWIGAGDIATQSSNLQMVSKCVSMHRSY